MEEDEKILNLVFFYYFILSITTHMFKNNLYSQFISKTGA